MSKPETADLPLFPEENPDILADAVDIGGQDWVDQPNSYLGGISPRKVIEAGNFSLLRNYLRLVRYVGMS